MSLICAKLCLSTLNVLIHVDLTAILSIRAIIKSIIHVGKPRPRDIK